MTDRLAQLVALFHADPNDPFLTYGIALEHGKSGRIEEALRWLDQTLQIDAAYCYAYYQKARMLRDLGREQDARQALHEGMRRAAGKDEHARDEMAELLEELG